MFRVLYVFFIFHFLIGCSSFEQNDKNEVYSAFEDDFFGEDKVSSSKNNTQAVMTNNDEYSSGVQFDEYGEPVSNLYDNNDSAIQVINNQMSASNEFAGDNYIFSFDVGEGESLKERMRDLLEPYGYKLIWKTDYEVYFENDVLYEDKLLVNVLKGISSDLLKMGIDIHINVYLKNKVVLVYSVRS